MKKKLLTALAFSTVTLTSVFSSSASAAGDGDWTTVGTFDVHVTSNSNVLKSTGGNIQITMWDSYANSQARSVEVWEDDPAGDDYITTILLKPGVPVTIKGIDSFIDGTDRKAEIYLVPNGTIGQSSVKATMKD